MILLLPQNLVDAKIFSLFSTNRTNPQYLRPRSSTQVIDTKGFLNLPKLLVLLKQLGLLPPRNLVCVTFGGSLMMFTTKVTLSLLFLSVFQRSCLLHLIRWSCLVKFFWESPVSMIQVALFVISLLELS